MRWMFKNVSLMPAVIVLMGCDRIGNMAGGTEAAPVSGGSVSEIVCAEWAGSLPTRSRADTAQTQTEIELAYDVFAASCPRAVQEVLAGL